MLFWLVFVLFGVFLLGPRFYFHVLFSPLSLSSCFQTQIQSNLYKTELCRTFEDTGSCRYGNRCQFAHGEEELRPVARHPRYKSEVCKAFHQTGVCSYGQRCRFIHQSSVDGGSPASPRALPSSSSITSSPMNSPLSKKALSAGTVVPAIVASSSSTNEPEFLNTVMNSPRRLPFFRALANEEDEGLTPSVFTAIGPVTLDTGASAVQQRYSMAGKVTQPLFRSGPMAPPMAPSSMSSPPTVTRMMTHSRSDSFASANSLTSLMSLEF